MVFPRWRQSLARSLHVHRSKPESKFFQAASVVVTQGTNDLTVENRTLVFRGFEEDSDNLLAITDTRTDKYTQWQQTPQSQICWYFAKTREQYRISSTVCLVGPKRYDSDDINKDIRLKVWEGLSEKAHAQFLWPTSKKALGKNDAQFTNNDNNIPDTFAVVIFKPIYVDYLNLTTAPQTRELHSIINDTGKWVCERVNP
jgi:pyridoxamine 5'-phosphate oxidase